jgi:hypothetical protein
MRRVHLTRRKAVVGVLVAGALAQAILAIAVFAQNGTNDVAAVLPLHPVAGTFKPDGTKLEDCSQQTCFEQAFGNIAYVQGPRVALALFDRTYGDFSDPDCHRVAHAIGSASLARNKGNVARTFAQGTSSCFSGYYHGVLERSLLRVKSYNAGALGAVARSLCSEPQVRKSVWLTFQCLHGLGHGLMITTGYALPLSLKVCDQLATGWETTTCNGGVFMENISSSYGFTSQWIRDDDPVYPCSWVATEDKLKCYELVTSRIVRVLGGNWAKTAATCTTVESAWRSACFRSFGRDVAGQAHYEPVGIKTLCALTTPYDGEGSCIKGAATTMVSNFASGKQASALCRMSSPQFRGSCYYGIGTVVVRLQSRDARSDAGCRSITADATDLAPCVRGANDYLRLVRAES